METLTFLKFWRNLGGGAAAASDILTAESDDDEGSLFELELAVPPAKKDVCCKESSVVTMIPSPKDLFFKNRVMPLEPTSKAHSPISSLKSTPKFRVFALGLKKSKSQKTEPLAEKRLGDLLEELPRGGTKLGRENSSRSSKSKIPNESKGFSKDRVQKYLKLIRASSSKGESEKVKFSETASFKSYSSSPAAFMPKKTGLRSCKQLGKSRSASASATSIAGVSPPAVSRRDDSLLLQHDGIQSAIQYCKRSLSSSSDTSSHLSRSTSSPCDQKSMDLTRKSSGERES